MKKAILSTLLLLVLSQGCTSTIPCECPEIELPAVVEKKVYVPVVLPTPPPPLYVEPMSYPNIFRNWVEAIRAYRRCVDIIEANNGDR